LAFTEKHHGVNNGSKTHSRWLSYRDALHTVREAAKVVDFLKQAFARSRRTSRSQRPDGKIMHAEVKIGDSRVMLAEESEMAKPSSSTLYLYFANVDDMYRRPSRPAARRSWRPTDMFYGDRCGGVKDPSGNSWMIATHKEDVAPQELKERAEDFCTQQKHKAA
jgi:uncharacterized glyoxalase superfamily protein PhnB